VAYRERGKQGNGRKSHITPHHKKEKKKNSSDKTGNAMAREARGRRMSQPTRKPSQTKKGGLRLRKKRKGRIEKNSESTVVFGGKGKNTLFLLGGGENPVAYQGGK